MAPLSQSARPVVDMLIDGPQPTYPTASGPFQSTRGPGSRRKRSRPERLSRVSRHQAATCQIPPVLSAGIKHSAKGVNPAAGPRDLARGL
jgi:hypothetical protein